MVLVEVLEALPGRPISGERLVRPDGKISLGFYGDVEIAGLTLPEAKEKIVLHLRKYLSDEVLGLLEVDSETGEPKTDAESKLVRREEPKDTDRVFVEVTAYNSRHSYIEGDVVVPGSFPFTGSERVLDVIHWGGGLLPTADHSKIKLIRSFPKGSPVQVLPIDYEEITMGSDSSTNYEIKPFDRIVVPSDPSKSGPVDFDRSTRPPSTKPVSPDDGHAKVYFERRPETRSTDSLRIPHEVERRLDEMDKKLDAILERLGGPKK
jgi:polysaccharide biosynthesis/export protein